MLQERLKPLFPMRDENLGINHSDDRTIWEIPSSPGPEAIPLICIPESIKRRREQEAEEVITISSDEEDNPPCKKVRRLQRGRLNAPSPTSELFPLKEVPNSITPRHRRDISRVLNKEDGGKGVLTKKEHNLRQEGLKYMITKLTESFEKELGTSTNNIGHFERRAGSHDADLEIENVAITPRAPSAGRRNLFEHLPSEILITILSLIEHDQNLVDTFSAAPALGHYGLRGDWQVWQNRFLALYDAPVIEHKDEWMIAYQLRQFVLRRLSYRFEHEDQEHMNVQLQVVKDMVLEAYNALQRPDRHPKTGKSKNLDMFSSLEGANWMINLLSASCYAEQATISLSGARRPQHDSRTQRSSSPDCPDQDLSTLTELFSALQVTLSYLVLNPSLIISPWIRSDRDRYILAQVYCWNQPLVTLWRKRKTDCDGDTLMTDEAQNLADEATQVVDQTNRPFARFPNLKRPQPRVEVIKVDRTAYELDMHSLLHIRNFWQRHLIRDSVHEDNAREHTYTDMMQSIVQAQSICGKSRDMDKIRMLPSQWDEQLEDRSIYSGHGIKSQWLGHYTCVHPWPKNEAGLKEAQTCAEKWTEADPLTLEISSTTDGENNFWPVIFADIPILNDSIPPPEWFAGEKGGESEQMSSRAGPYTYLRGLAPFVDIKQILADANAAERTSGRSFIYRTGIEYSTLSPESSTLDPKSTPSTTSTTTTNPKTSSSIGPVKYHPYASLRLRGIVHPIPTSLPSTSTHNAYTQSELADIPGWQRIIMVLYKPMTLYLIQVLENAMQDYVYLEDPFGPGLDHNAEVVRGLGDKIRMKGIVIPPVPGMAMVSAIEAEVFHAATTSGVSAGAAMAAASPFLTQEEIHEVVRGVLERYVVMFEGFYAKYGRGGKDAFVASTMTTPASSVSASGMDGNGEGENRSVSPIWTAEFIHQLEAEFSPLASLDTDHNATEAKGTTSSSSAAPPLQWEDIEYAYVYEGALLPGGKMMMGRWWRCGTVLGGGDGGEGFEVVEDNTITGEEGDGGMIGVEMDGAGGVGGGQADADTEMNGAGADGVGDGDGEMGGEGTARIRGGWGRERGAWVFWS